MRFRVFDTSIGWFGLGWTEGGVSRVLLPGMEPGWLRDRLTGEGGIEDEQGQGALVARIVAYADGAEDGFENVALDLSATTAFNRRIYDHIRELRWGQTTTYGAIARWLGDVSLSRAVGAAMGKNPIPLIVPCHRVLAADGRTGGFSAPGGVRAKLEMLALERASSPDGQFSLGI